jgi:hypothetical protein
MGAVSGKIHDGLAPGQRRCQVSRMKLEHDQTGTKPKPKREITMTRRTENATAPLIATSSHIFAASSDAKLGLKTWGRVPGFDKNSTKSMFCNLKWWSRAESNR